MILNSTNLHWQYHQEHSHRDIHPNNHSDSPRSIEDRRHPLRRYTNRTHHQLNVNIIN